MKEKDKFIAMVASVGNIDEIDKIKDDASLFEDLHFDSLAVVELLSTIEQEFAVDFTVLPDFLERFESVGKIWEGIQILSQ